MLVRGGDLDPDILRADAMRYHSIYGTYGISVFALRDVTVDELAQQVPLVRFDRLTLLTVGIRPGVMLVAGNRQAQAVVRVVAVDEDGQVHFTVLPGSVEKNRHLIGRALA